MQAAPLLFATKEVLLRKPSAIADPGLYDIPPQYAGAFANTYLQKRARAATKLGKPYIVEGVGLVCERAGPPKTREPDNCRWAWLGWTERAFVLGLPSMFLRLPLFVSLCHPRLFLPAKLPVVQRHFDSLLLRTFRNIPEECAAAVHAVRSQQPGRHVPHPVLRPRGGQAAHSLPSAAALAGRGHSNAPRHGGINPTTLLP